MNVAASAVNFYAVGDICINREDPESAFALCSQTLAEADVAFCQLETMYSERGHPAIVTPNPMRAHPRNAAPLSRFHVISLAGNHCLDWGEEALMDTIALLGGQGSRVLGVGENIVAARKPVILESKGNTIAFLAYNSILPQRYWAESRKPGCAPVRVSTLYQALEHDQPGGPCEALTYPNREDLEAMIADVKAAKRLADVVTVSMHWGLHFVPAKLATYQHEVGHAAIDAGADLIVGHHAHILKGIDVYKGKVIAFSLGNFVFDLFVPNAEAFWTPKRKRMQEHFPNRVYDPDYPTYPYPAESRNTIVLKATIADKHIKTVSFVPALINRHGQPEVLSRQDRRSDGVIDYVQRISQGLAAEMSREGDEVIIETGP